MNLMGKLIGISLLTAFFSMPASAYVSVRIGLPFIYSAPTYSYGCGHVGEPPCQYPNTYYSYPSVGWSSVYYDPWDYNYYYYSPRHHHPSHHGYHHPPHHGHHHVGHGGPHRSWHGHGPSHHRHFGPSRVGHRSSPMRGGHGFRVHHRH